jgi:hypothetical protein
MNLRRNRDPRTAPETPHRLRYGTALLLRLVHRLRRAGPVERPHAGAVPGWSPLAETSAVAPAVPLMETDVDADLRWAEELHHFEHFMQSLVSDVFTRLYRDNATLARWAMLGDTGTVPTLA